MVKEGLREEVVSGPSSEGSKRISHVKTCRLRIPGNNDSKCKGREVGTCLSEEEQESQDESERYGDQGGLARCCRDLRFYSGWRGSRRRAVLRSDTDLTSSFVRSLWLLC